MTPVAATAGALTPELLLGLVERAGRPDFPAFEAQLRSSGYCARPVRLRGRIETCDAGGVKRVWSTMGEPDGVLRKACGNRREAVCPPCAERYRQDAYHLVGAGLRGGKGVPDTVSGHPAVFLTLTAPSFGPVHTRRLGADGQPRPCRPRRDRPVCEHGRSLFCTAVHGEDDACLGEPLCRECWDYQGAVVWNHTLGKLWRHTTMKIKRGLAREAGMTQKRFNRRARPAYAKVAEYQQRGLVHLHVLVRLDRAMPDYRSNQVRPPARRFTVEQLEAAIRTAIEEVSAPVDDELGGGRVQWGEMVDIHPLQSGNERAQIAGYLAKYSTKSTELAGGLLHRIDPDDVDTAPVREHVKDYMRTAFALNAEAVRYRKQHPPHIEPSPAPDVETDWQPCALVVRVQRAIGSDEALRVRLHDGTVHTGRAVRLTTGPERADTTQVVELDDGELVHLGDIASIGPADRKQRRDPPPPRLAACAHAFGYRGHCLTKSRRYSTTFKQLRADREAWVHAQILARSRDATQRALAAAQERVVMLEVDGIGHVTASDTHYALAEHARARERRRIGREEYGGQVIEGDQSEATGDRTGARGRRRVRQGGGESEARAWGGCVMGTRGAASAGGAGLQDAEFEHVDQDRAA